MSAKNSNIEEISFYSDGFVLTGTLHLPAADRPPVVIGCHGLYSDRNSPKQIALATACNAHNIGYFRFDHRGCGNSQGKFESVTSLDARCRDLKNAMGLIKRRKDTGHHIGLFGSSMGGTVCLCVAGEHKVSGIVTFAAPLRSAVRQEGPGQSASPEAGGIFLDAGKSDFDVSANLPRICNILIVHGEADETVPLSHALEIRCLAGEPKKLVVQPDGDHRMSNADHQKVFVREAAGWLKSALIDN